MKIVIFGATGRTGQLLTESALDQGHVVTAAVRRPEALEIEHPHLRKVCCDLFDAAAVAGAILGQECILMAVAPTNAVGTTTIFSTAIKNILAAAKQENIRRLLVLGSCGVDGDTITRLHLKLLAGLIVHSLLFGLYIDTARMEGILEASDCDWTVVRPPRLTNEPAKKSYRIGVGHHLTNVASIPRADVADAMLRFIDDPKTYRKWVEVASDAWI